MRGTPGGACQQERGGIVSTADLAIIVNGITELALIGTIGALFYTKRLLFASSPKPPAQQLGEGKGTGHG